MILIFVLQTNRRPLSFIFSTGAWCKNNVVKTFTLAHWRRNNVQTTSF